jgi:hypothetical protein
MPSTGQAISHSDPTHAKHIQRLFLAEKPYLIGNCGPVKSPCMPMLGQASTRCFSLADDMPLSSLCILRHLAYWLVQEIQVIEFLQVTFFGAVAGGLWGVLSQFPDVCSLRFGV